MRIVYVLTTLAMGGTERLVLALASHMAARGHAVKLVVLKAPEPDGCATDLDVVYLNLKKSAAGLVAGLRSGARVLREFRPGIIHSHNFHGNMLARCLRILVRGPKLVSTIHNIYEGGWTRMLAYRLTDPAADCTTAVSKAVAERYVRLKAVPRSKCSVLTNGIETAEFVPDAKRREQAREQMGVTDEFVWLAVGRMTIAKDIPNLLQAFGNVCRASDRAKLWLAGEAPAKEPRTAQYFAITMPHGAMDRVRRLGMRRDIPALLDAADGFVLSSAWEGMPLALGEAMAMEKPVVATDVGGVRDLVGDAGVLVPAKDAKTLAKAMLAVMSMTAEDRAAMGQAARKRILTGFSMDRKAGEWETLYRSLLD